MKRIVNADEKENAFLKKHLTQMFHIYLESDVSDARKDRQNKLYTFIQLKKKLNK